MISASSVRAIILSTTLFVYREGAAHHLADQRARSQAVGRLGWHPSGAFLQIFPDGYFLCECVCLCVRGFVRRMCLVFGVGTPPARSYI